MGFRVEDDVTGFLPDRERAVRDLAAELRQRGVPVELATTADTWRPSWVFGVRLGGRLIRGKYVGGQWRYRLQPNGLEPSDDLPPDARDFGDAFDVEAAADAVEAWLNETDERPVYVATDHDQPEPDPEPDPAPGGPAEPGPGETGSGARPNPGPAGERSPGRAPRTEAWWRRTRRSLPSGRVR